MSAVRYFSRADLVKLIGKSESSLDRDVKAGLLDRPVKIGMRRVAWPEPAVETYQQRLMERHRVTPPIPSPVLAHK